MKQLETKSHNFKLLILGFFCSLFSISFLSLNNLTKESFINEVYRSYVDSSIAFFYLDSQCVSNTQILCDSFQIRRELKGLITNHEINLLLSEIKSDSQTIYWKENDLQKAKCISSDDLNDMTNDIIVVAPKFWWRHIFKEKAFEKDARKQYEILNKNKTLEEKKGYRFSQPYFSKSGRFALIYLSYHCGINCGQSCIVLYEKQGNDWIERKRFICKIA